MAVVRNDDAIPRPYDNNTTCDLPHLGQFLTYYKPSRFYSYSLNILGVTKGGEQNSYKPVLSIPSNLYKIVQPALQNSTCHFRGVSRSNFQPS